MGEGGPKDQTVMAATIGAIAVVAAAAVQAFGGGLFPTPAPSLTPSATPSPTPTPSASPTIAVTQIGPLHEIHVQNDCEKPFQIMFHYHGADGWTNNNGAY